MKLKSLFFVCCVLWAVVSVTAQSVTDVVSGTWTLESGSGGLALKFDGKRVASGLVNPSSASPGEIKTGTFDPQTGALKLEGEIKGPDGAQRHFVIEGQLAQSIITANAVFGEQKFAVKLTKIVEAAAPQSSADETTAALRKNFAQVSGWVTKAVDLVPADKYNYRPASSVRTFGQMVAHIADSYNYYCTFAAGKQVQWSDAIEKGNTDKAALVQQLKQATATCQAVYGSTGKLGALVENIAHTNLHYGNLITYLRMLDLTPPSN